MKTTSFLQILGIVLCTASFSACTKHTDKPKDDIKTETSKNNQATVIEPGSTNSKMMDNDTNAPAMDEDFLDEKEAQKALADGEIEEVPNANTGESPALDEDVCVDENYKAIPCP